MTGPSVFTRAITLAFLAALLSSCAPVKYSIVKLAPVVSDEGVFADQADLSASMKKENIRVSAKYVSLQDLNEASLNGFNPFASGSKRFYSVFEVVIENDGDDKIRFDPAKCVLLDGQKNQFNALAEEYFNALFPTSTAVQSQKRPVQPYEVPTYYYTDDYYKRAVVSKKLFKPGDIYPKVKMSGWVVFEQFRIEAPVITLVAPEIVVFKDNVELKKFDFKFRFEQSVEVKEK